MTTPRAARCIGCGDVASSSWLTFDVYASPGPRGFNRISTISTEARRLRLCPHCTDTGKWAAFAQALSDHGERAEGYGDRCVVLCSSHKPRKSHNWAKLSPRAVVTWPGSGQYRCPMCYRRALGWTTWSSPAAVRKLAARVVRRRRLPARQIEN